MRLFLIPLLSLFIAWFSFGTVESLPCDSKVKGAARDNSLEYAKACEAANIANASKVFRRSGPTATVLVKKGKPLTFKDASGTSYNLADHSKTYVLIHKQLSEGNAYILVDLGSGTASTLSSLPQWSPSKKLFAVANADHESRYTPNKLEIWSCDSGGCKLAWTFKQPKDEMKQTGGESAVWESDSEVRFTTSHITGENGIDTTQGKLTCILSHHNWICK